MTSVHISVFSSSLGCDPELAEGPESLFLM